MADRAVQRRGWNYKRVSKATRFLSGELTRRPAFLKGIEHRVAVTDDKQLTVDGLPVVPEEEAPAMIKKLDDDPRYSGGRDRLYGHVARQAFGVTRRMVDDYIRNSEAHQLTRPKPPVVRHRAIVVRAPGLQAQVDLIGPLPDAALNNGFEYVLTYVDLFSKWAAARPLKNKEGKTVVAATDSIFESLSPDQRPRVLQADNGSEFKEGFARHIKETWGSKVIHSSAYRPSTQGQVERLNSTLKSLLNAHMGKYGSKRWVDILQACIENINSTKHSTTGHTPTEIVSDPSLQKETAAAIKDAAEKRQGPVDALEAVLEVGDSVRVALTTRDLARKGQLFAKSAGKQHWSARVYAVRTISRPRNKFDRKQYLLRSGKRDLTKRYYAAQLQKIDPEALIKNDLTVEQRPVYDEKKFDLERHLRVDLPQRAVEPATPEPKQAQPVRRSGRARKQVDRYIP